ncbi:acyl-CoA dehydrogenase family protein [Chengkuizengella marina]|uniref:Acyl-CoA dehydrogenase n=1 Tax=Chengkuizengella marina TaxID=2507566 RepID=A0A6N9Q719_9BACL|nr:acyl-CoA dehydrogenase family protein [Chengkuizengella marina]NBI30599.1 acyl-CoA dehydrogenase [Chengkuizengella marina]
MLFELNETQRNNKKRFRKFVNDEIIPVAGQHDRLEKIDEIVISKMKENRYLGSMIPEAYGGLGMDMISLGILNEEIGRGCASVRSMLTVHGMVALAILRWGTEEQKQYWLPKMAAGDIIGAFGLTEPDVGSDAKSIKTTVEMTENRYILNGTKKWTTMGQIADIFLIFAQFEGKPGAFIVERSNVNLQITAMHGLLGARASMIAELNFNDCIIPENNLIGKVGIGLSHVAFSCLDYGRYTIAWGCIGTAQAALEASIDYAGKREQFGKKIKENQLIQKMIAEMYVQVKAGRLLCYQAASLREKGDPDSIMETWVAKYFCSTMVNKVAGDAVQIHGGNGCYNEYDVERYYRDAKINEIIEGTTQIHEILISKHSFSKIKV